MVTGVSLLLDVPFRIQMRGGSVASMPLPDALAHPNAVRIAFGHSYLDCVANNFVVCAVQSFMFRSDTNGWTERFNHPPSADEIRAAFKPWATCFDLVHPDRPYMQVRFQDLSSSADASGSSRKKTRPQPKERDDAGADLEADAEEGVIDLCLLFPDETSTNQRLPKKSGEHFTKRGRVSGLGASASAMLLSGGNVVGVGGGGGYFSPGTKGAALVRLELPDTEGLNDSFWRSTWLNVAHTSYPGLAGLESHPAIPETMFGWMAPELRRTRGKSEDDKVGFARAEAGMVKIGDREVPVHPFATMWGMSRRAELAPPQDGVCSLTGIEGPVWFKVEVQPGGPRSPLLRRSWHPLIGIRKPPQKDTGQKAGLSVNKGPESGIFRAAEWSSFFPAKSISVADLEAHGMPPAVAMLVDNERRGAIHRLLRAAVGTAGRSPTLPLLAVAVRQDRVLEGWSEGSVRLWTGDRALLGNLSGLLDVLKNGTAEAQKLIAAAVDAAERHAPALRAGKDAKGFKARLKSGMADAVEVKHDELGWEALDEAARVGSGADDDVEAKIEAIGGMLRAVLRDACLEVVRNTNYGVFGGVLIREVAVLAAEAEAAKQSEKAGSTTSRQGGSRNE